MSENYVELKSRLLRCTTLGELAEVSRVISNDELEELSSTEQSLLFKNLIQQANCIKPVWFSVERVSVCSLLVHWPTMVH